MTRLQSSIAVKRSAPEVKPPKRAIEEKTPAATSAPPKQAEAPRPSSGNGSQGPTPERFDSTALDRTLAGPSTFDRLLTEPSSTERVLGPQTTHPLPAPLPVLGLFVPYGRPPELDATAESQIPVDTGSIFSYIPVEGTPGESASSDVDTAAEALDMAIAERDRQPWEVQRFYQPAVAVARAELREAVRTEIMEGSDDPSTAASPDEVAERGQDIVDRQVDGSLPAIEVRKVVDDLVQEARTETEIADTLEYIDGADSAEQAFERLDERFETISPAARQSLLEDEAVRQVLDDVTVNAAEPLVDPPENVPQQILLEEMLQNLEVLLPEDIDPDLAAAVLDRALPAFDNLAAGQERWESRYGAERELLNVFSLKSLGRLSDRVTGANDEQRIITELGRLAMYDGFPESVLDVSDGNGLPLALEIARLSEANPDIDSGLVLDRILDNYERFLGEDGPVNEAINAYALHTEELTYYISLFPPGLPTEERQQHIDTYLENEGADWLKELEALELELAAHGADVLLMQEQLTNLPPELAHLSDEVDARLTEIADADNFSIAVTTAANRHPELLVDIDIPAALDFFKVTGLSGKSVGLTEALVNAHFQTVVAPAVGTFDPLDSESVRSARTAINSMRTQSFADAWGLDLDSELGPALDALLETLPDGSSVVNLPQAEASLRNYQNTLDGLKAFGPDSVPGFVFRSLGLSVSVVGTFGSASALRANPTLENAAAAFVDSVSTLQDTTAFLDDVGLLADDSASPDDSDRTGRLAGCLAVPALYWEQ